MNAKNRAEKIMKALCEMGCCDRDESDPICDDHQTKYLTTQIEQIRSSVLEELAVKFENFGMDITHGPRKIAEMIRALKKGENSGSF